jgi:hypothetical protein
VLPVPAFDVPVGQSVQTRSSFSSVEYVPLGHPEQEVDVDEDMNKPGGQQPYRAVLEPRLLKAFSLPVKDFHAPPHNDRLNPLS